MKMQPLKGPQRLWSALTQRWQQRLPDWSGSIWLHFKAVVGVAGFVLVLRSTGLLQSLEWAAYDQMFRWRPPEHLDDRILIVGINETDIREFQTWPISDRVLAELLQRLDSYSPRAIGLDLYRDIPVEPGHAELQQVFATTPNLIGIEEVPIANNLIGVRPPKVLAELGAVGFNNVAIDSDGTIRRNLLYLWGEEKSYQSLALKLALLYLQTEGIKLQPSPEHPKHFQLGPHTFPRFERNDGPYIHQDNGGYQVLANFHVGDPVESELVPYREVSMRQVLEGEVPADWVRDRVVLIGSTATSINDFFYTPQSSGLFQAPKKVFGVQLHANFVSQILSAALDDRPPSILFWSEPIEWLWIVLWAIAGAIISSTWRSPVRLTGSILLASVTLFASATLLFLLGWWVPLIPPLLTLIGSAGLLTSYIAYHEEKLKRSFAESKDFLDQIINTIPDPIFVKDKNHRWIVLNQAFCQLIGYPLQGVLEKSDYELFSTDEAQLFWQEDEWVLTTGLPHENEAKLTDATGTLHYIATKRSLHKDSAGNVFLVGVIRDITERKQMEEELKRTASELAQSYQELKVSEDRLRHQAYHDTLTNLPNRKLFSDRLNQALEWAAINNQIVAVLFIDLDGFKQINDTLGHDSGDLLLKEVAKRLTSCLRGSDTVARLGGDEFTVILPAIPRPQDVASVAQKIMTTLGEPVAIAQDLIQITASIGISLYPLNGEDAATLIKLADAAMYRSKELGKNQYEFYEVS
jgi:diguanylate cyclase (GGDEF)-like protein/PAS domain S-box-containing protein